MLHTFWRDLSELEKGKTFHRKRKQELIDDMFLFGLVANVYKLQKYCTLIATFFHSTILIVNFLPNRRKRQQFTGINGHRAPMSIYVSSKIKISKANRIYYIKYFSFDSLQ